MNKSGKELSGRHLHRFLKRFLETQDDIKPVTAERIARILGVTFSAARLRRHPAAFSGRHARLKSLPSGSHEQEHHSTPPDKTSAQLENNKHAAAATGTEEKFDPYAFGLVPIFRLEGPEGLMQRLNEIRRLDHLRKMARLQQIILPAELRHGDTAIEDVRSAIVAAVHKRIADRRAAAG